MLLNEFEKPDRRLRHLTSYVVVTEEKHNMCTICIIPEKYNTNSIPETVYTKNMVVGDDST